jgi:hypothetical protein
MDGVRLEVERQRCALRAAIVVTPAGGQRDQRGEQGETTHGGQGMRRGRRIQR